MSDLPQSMTKHCAGCGHVFGVSCLLSKAQGQGGVVTARRIALVLAVRMVLHVAGQDSKAQHRVAETRAIQQQAPVSVRSSKEASAVAVEAWQGQQRYVGPSDVTVPMA